VKSPDLGPISKRKIVNPVYEMQLFARMLCRNLGLNATQLIP